MTQPENSNEEWIRYLKETGQFERYSGTCDCWACREAREGFDGWKTLQEKKMKKSKLKRRRLPQDLFVVGVRMFKNIPGGAAHTMSISAMSGKSSEEVIGHATKYALSAKPDFAIEQVLAGKISGVILTKRNSKFESVLQT